jgi:uncharacterized membrane protein
MKSKFFDKMYHLKKKYIFIYRSILLTPILFIIAMLFTGGGHGTSFFLVLFYPFSTLFLFIFPNCESVLFPIGLLQYILYGIILTIAERKGKLISLIIIISAIHIFTILLCLSFQFIVKHGW